MKTKEIEFETPRNHLQPMYVVFDIGDELLPTIFYHISLKCQNRGLEPPVLFWEQQIALDGSTAPKKRLKVLSHDLAVYYTVCEQMGAYVGAEAIESKYMTGVRDLIGMAKKMGGLEGEISMQTDEVRLLIRLFNNGLPGITKVSVEEGELCIKIDLEKV